LKGTRISYTGALLVLGIAMGAAGAYLWLKKDRKFSDAYTDENFDCDTPIFLRKGSFFMGKVSFHTKIPFLMLVLFSRTISTLRSTA
jgi:hypothetical protein